MQKIILASSSPRRKKLLGQIGLKFKVEKSRTEEKIEDDMLAFEAVQKLAYDKAKSVASLYPSDIVIGADTVVAVDSKILGKPSNRKDAFEMLSSLSGKKHQVLTGIAVVCEEMKKIVVDYSITDVFFKKLTTEEITNYIKSAEPFDKAGGYGIQGLGACLIDKIDGCYFNVVGLPISLLVDILKEFNIKVLG